MEGAILGTVRTGPTASAYPVRKDSVAKEEFAYQKNHKYAFLDSCLEFLLK
jgi:hypothetical protein